MAIRVYKPTTAGRRNASVSDFSELTRSTPEKSLVRKLSKTGGRNSYGRMTSRHRGGGHKRQYRLIDFKRWDKDGVPAKVAHIEYDPNRSARIALLHYADGEKRYIIAPEGIKQGDVIETGAQADIKPGNNLPLRNIPTGTVVHAIELRPLGGAKIARSAGAAVQLVAKDEKAMAEFVSAVAQNKALGEELRQCVTQFANLLVAMQAQMNAMQRDLQSKVTISTAQAKAIQDAVKGHSEAICSAKGLSYERSGKALRAAIYRDFCKEFAVASRHDLPANKFRSAVEFVEEWSSLSLVRRLREKEKESDAENGNAGRCR